MSVTMTSARVERITPLTDSIIELVLVTNRYIFYQAGQYLQICERDEFLSYSIANAPLGSHQYELHIRHDNKNPYTLSLFNEIKQQGVLTIRLPLGDCHLNQLHPEMPIIFIAGGTGFAPIKAMIEQLLASGDPRPFELFWGARSRSDLYMEDKVHQWQTHVSHLRYTSMLPSANSEEKLSTLILRQHGKNVNKYQYVICGPFDMALATRDALIEAGVDETQLYSDAFSMPEKRSI